MSLIGLGNPHKPNTPSIIYLDLHVGLSIFYIDPIHIILSGIHLKISQGRNDSPIFSFYKKTRLIGYKYLMNPSISIFIIFILYCIYIFRVYFSRISLYFLSLKRYLLKHPRVSKSIKINLLQVPVILDKENESDC